MKKILVSLLLVLSFVLTDSLPFVDSSIVSVEAASIKLNTTSKTLIKGTSYTLKVKGTKKKVKWSSSKKSVATVTSKGKVTAKKNGIAYISAKVGKKTYKCKIKVETPALSLKSMNLIVGESYTLKLKGNSQKVTWTSSQKTLATVSSKGSVKGKKAGNVTIVAKVAGKSYKCNVKVIKPTGKRIYHNSNISVYYVSTQGYQDEYMTKFNVYNRKDYRVDVAFDSVSINNVSYSCYEDASIKARSLQTITCSFYSDSSILNKNNISRVGSRMVLYYPSTDKETTLVFDYKLNSQENLLDLNQYECLYSDDKVSVYLYDVIEYDDNELGVHLLVDHKYKTKSSAMFVLNIGCNGTRTENVIMYDYLLPGRIAYCELYVDSSQLKTDIIESLQGHLMVYDEDTGKQLHSVEFDKTLQQPLV